MNPEPRGQFSPQLPGPRGSPHDPQAPMGAQDAAEAEDDDFVDTANTECCLSSASLLHVGHAAGREALTMASK